MTIKKMIESQTNKKKMERRSRDKSVHLCLFCHNSRNLIDIFFCDILTAANSDCLRPLLLRPSWMILPTSKGILSCFNSSVSRSNFAVFLVMTCCLFVPAPTASKRNNDLIRIISFCFDTEICKLDIAISVFFVLEILTFDVDESIVANSKEINKSFRIWVQTCNE